jgi:transposase
MGEWNKPMKWSAFIYAVKAKSPQATLVFDNFHIVRKLTEAVDVVRHQENLQAR